MSLEDAALILGIIASLVAIVTFLFLLGRYVWKRLRPRWERFLLGRGRVRCPKCQRIFNPKFEVDPDFGIEYADCPHCNTHTAKEYWAESPPDPEEAFLPPRR